MKILLRKFISTGVIAGYSCLLFSGIASASTPVSKGYVSSDPELKPGMAVALSGASNSNEQSVERASNENKSRYLGIATKIEDSVIAISSKNTTVYVADTGQYSLYVSDLAGEIKQGDLLVLSPLRGLLMKSTNRESGETVVAIALADFKPTGSKQDIKTDSGDSRQVGIGQIEAEVNTSTVINEEPNKFFSVFGESLTGKPVSEIRVLVACIILLIVLIVEGSVLYGAVSSSITAVGRNPLSKASVYKQLVHTSFLALGVLLFGIAGIYVVIWT